MSGSLMPPSGGDDRVRADVVLSEVPVGPGEPAYVEVEVTNVSEVIRSYRIDVLGLDARWSQSDGVDLELFPGERRSTTLSIELPPDFPAGRRRIAVEVTEPDVRDGSVVVIDVDLLVEPREELSFAVEPASMTVGGEGTFVVTPVNSGNTTLDVQFAAADPERKVDVTFDPAVPSLLPGERGVVRATVRGPRPWFGMPLVRVLEFRATAGGAQATTAAAFVQTPRFSRRLVSMAGLVVVATLFAFVIFLSFGSVADLAAANEALLKQSLGEDQPVGLRVEPSSVTGTVTALTGGGIDGVSVELYAESNPLVPLKSTVTDVSGAYRFSALSRGTYFVRFQVAGFGEAWFRRGTSIADATPLEIVAGEDLVDVDVALSGQSGTVIGRVVGEDVDGALVVAQIPATSIEDSELTPVAARLAEVVVDATGMFTLEDLPTPAGYEIVVSKPEFSVQRRSLTLLAGEVRRDFEILLRAGGGLIGGTVVDLSGDPIPGATVVVSDGQTEVSTRSLSEAELLGTFEVRDLATPSTYAVTVSAPGFFPATQNIVLGLDQQITERRVTLTPSAGSISGRVRSSSGDPLGGVEITVVGPGLRRTTQSVSTPLDWTGSEPPASAGTWRIDGLPLPGAYTVTFGAEGQLTQAVSVELVAGVASVRTGVDAVLDPSVGTIQGRVREAGPGADCDAVTSIGDADPCPLLSSRDDVVVTLRSTGLTRTVRPADTPEGRRGLFRFDNIPPGAYTVTVERPGSTSQTLLVNTAVVGGLSPAMLDVRLDRPAVIGGRIRLHLGFGGTRQFNVAAFTVDGVGGTPLASTTTDSAGLFTLRGLPAPGSYVLEFEDRETGARELFFTSQQLELEPGVPIAFDDVLFGDGTGTDLFFRDVPHGPAAQLAFGTSPPVGASVGQPLPAFTVEIRDAEGVRVSDGDEATSVVTISLGNNPSFAVLGGTISRAAVGGVVNFVGLELDQVGSGYTLRASSGVLKQVESPAFNVQPTVSSAPTAVTANAAFDGQVQISWTAPPDPSGAPVIDYRIERRTGSGPWLVAQTDQSIASGATTSRRVTGLTAGVSYEFRVLAVNSVGASAPSSASSAVTATVSPKTVSLADSGSVATGAFVERGYAFRLNTSVTVDRLFGGGSDAGFEIRIREGGTGVNPFPPSTALTVVASATTLGSSALEGRDVTPTVLEAGRWYWITQTRTSGSGFHRTTTTLAIQAATDRGLIRDWRFDDRNAWSGDTTLPALGFRVQ